MRISNLKSRVCVLCTVGERWACARPVSGGADDDMVEVMAVCGGGGGGVATTHPPNIKSQLKLMES